MLGACSEADQRDVRPFPRGHRADVFDVDLAGDHLVAQGDHDRGDEREAVFATVI